MSDEYAGLPVIRSVKLQADGRLKVRLHLPTTKEACEGHELTLFLPVEGSGIGEPTRASIAAELSRLAGDANMAFMRLNKTH
ncbi:hypothetical protein [Gluconobacter oxydans]|uniref:hypothetical protein n=1 Tax=Gluconobacter oxydans TaxID=442 RepID=UPI0039EBC76A